MKKIILLSIVSLALTTSCKKKYNCECTFGALKSIHTYEDFEDQAKTTCDDYNKEAKASCGSCVLIETK